ncbi:uncharacterized protein LOC103717348 [Phoenix dactylifera]|uniref:Uncharacterized protein LOC103717348 n=1 Tax=Phoenix dactylifera TaxID=42345 RepID=A0A8B7CQ42_PHODC|nr:uncharacterized protein LOC103717348 [Phoenix dactylifera]
MLPAPTRPPSRWALTGPFSWCCDTSGCLSSWCCRGCAGGSGMRSLATGFCGSTPPSSRAAKLKSLSPLDCWKITDAGLLQVADRNPGITKLYGPGCIYSTADGVTKVVKQLFECKGNLKHLHLHGLCRISKEHPDVLNSFLCKNDPQQISRPSFYRYRHSLSMNQPTALRWDHITDFGCINSSLCNYLISEIDELAVEH